MSKLHSGIIDQCFVELAFLEESDELILLYDDALGEELTCKGLGVTLGLRIDDRCNRGKVLSLDTLTCDVQHSYENSFIKRSIVVLE